MALAWSWRGATVTTITTATTGPGISILERELAKQIDLPSCFSLNLGYTYARGKRRCDEGFIFAFAHA